MKHKHRLMFQPSTWKLYLILIIPFVMYVSVVFFPLAYGFLQSLTLQQGLRKAQFVGLNNYVTLFNDAKWWLSVKNTFLITLMCVAGQIGIALVFTMFTTFRWVRLKETHRMLMFMPSVISGVVMGFIWQLLFIDSVGLINSILRALNMPTYAWLAEPSTILLVVTIPTIWQVVGYYMVLMVGGVSSIEESVLEAAEIDGASDFQNVWYIVLPLIRGSIGVALLFCIAGTLKIFDHINIMTNGGPGSYSMVMAQYAYNITFTAFNLGYGATISMGMFLLTMTVVVIVRRLVFGRDKNA